MSYSEAHYLFSSDPDNGAYNISATGNRFSVSFNPPLSFDNNATRLRLELLETELYYTNPNVNSTNNRLTITTHDINGVSMIYNVVVPTGLYELTALNTAIKNILVVAGANPNLISFVSNNSKSRVVMTLIGDTRVDFSEQFSIGYLFGFLPQPYAPIGPSSIDRKTVYEAPNSAHLNNINFFVLNSNIVNNGLMFNGSARQAIGRILITAEPSGQIVSTPISPYSIDITSLKYSSFSNLSFWMTDDTNNDISTSEPFSFRLRITTERE